jgi:hypothetical protein
MELDSSAVGGVRGHERPSTWATEPWRTSTWAAETMAVSPVAGAGVRVRAHGRPSTWRPSTWAAETMAISPVAGGNGTCAISPEVGGVRGVSPRQPEILPASARAGAYLILQTLGDKGPPANRHPHGRDARSAHGVQVRVADVRRTVRLDHINSKVLPVLVHELVHQVPLRVPKGAKAVRQQGGHHHALRGVVHLRDAVELVEREHPLLWRRGGGGEGGGEGCDLLRWRRAGGGRTDEQPTAQVHAGGDGEDRRRERQAQEGQEEAPHRRCGPIAHHLGRSRWHQKSSTRAHASISKWASLIRPVLVSCSVLSRLG